MAFVEVAVRTLVAVLCTVRAMAGLSVLFAGARQTLRACARTALLTTGCATRATIEIAEPSGEKAEGESKHYNTCNKELVSVHKVTPWLNN
jgi:hypothetical protein